MIIGSGCYASLKRRPSRVACNIGAGGCTGKHVICPTHLTEPQGKLKECRGLLSSLTSITVQ